MLILAADTSLPILSVALLDGDALLGAIALEGKSSRNEKLLPAIDWLLGECGVDRHRLDLFATTRGPGSFTGVRIGLATMQGMAMALGKPMCAMSTHEAIALGEGDRDATHPLERMLVYDDAGRGELYISLFEGHRETIAPRLASAEEQRELGAEAALAIRVAEFTQHANVAAGCARRAREIAEHGELARYTDVTPIYVRLAEAEVQLNLKRNA
ncbi:MAG TPA: tRNA (adenosine(37)-N6)-threonylcarbamoyltransferase complex dimerization subunit type 1 TsaB [Thermoanaerobaculia bacterium]|nr:tRNA (adenosine(37)-N6)-threonylcarbamoyltransferase complex dimerization subunit type 1 TsaB [Thermoanaerobaculia bacterium]